MAIYTASEELAEFVTNEEMQQTRRRPEVGAHRSVACIVLDSDSEGDRQRVEAEDALTWEERAELIGRVDDYRAAQRYGRRNHAFSSKDARLAVRHALAVIGPIGGRRYAQDDKPIDCFDELSAGIERKQVVNEVVIHWPATRKGF